MAKDLVEMNSSPEPLDTPRSPSTILISCFGYALCGCSELRNLNKKDLGDVTGIIEVRLRQLMRLAPSETQNRSGKSILSNKSISS